MARRTAAADTPAARAARSNPTPTASDSRINARCVAVMAIGPPT